VLKIYSQNITSICFDWQFLTLILYFKHKKKHTEDEPPQDTLL